MQGAMPRVFCIVVLLVALGIPDIKAQNKTTVEVQAKAVTNQTTADESYDGTAKERSKKSKADERKSEALATTNGCGAGCEVCHEDHCFSCSTGYQRINYNCAKKGCADPRCVDCSSDVCYQCVEGYAPDLDGACSWIGPTGCEEKNCMLCSETRIGCTECNPGYQLRSNRCFKKACTDKNCLRCSSSGKDCELCKEGFQSRLGECLAVGCLDDHCRQCSPSGGSCYRCEDGYYDDRVGGSCKSCPDSNCLNCNGSQRSCIRCTDGFYVGRLPTGKVGCVECTEAMDNCETCSRGGDDCYSCSSGYYLEHGHCIACPENCATCKSPWFCDTCKDDYDLYGSGLCQAGKNATGSTNSAEIRDLPILTFSLAISFHLVLFMAFI